MFQLRFKGLHEFYIQLILSGLVILGIFHPKIFSAQLFMDNHFYYQYMALLCRIKINEIQMSLS